MPPSIRSGNLDLGDFVTMLDASEETVLTAADASMSLGDRMAILQHKAEKALEPVGNLLIGAFEDAMPFLEGAGDHLADIGQGIADWAVQAQVAAAPFVAALQDQMAPAVEFFEGAACPHYRLVGGERSDLHCRMGEHCGGNSVGDRGSHSPDL